MNYDIEAEWYLNKVCNFRCNYCFFSPDYTSSKIIKYGTPMQWLEGFNATGKTWLIHLTGGEPSLYPDFVELCEKLTKQHYLSINTNLNHHCFSNFIKKINPARIPCINASIHFEERQKRGLWEIFIKRVQELQQAKFRVIPSLVMTPSTARIFPEISAYLETEGLVVIPKVMRGTYEGKIYPSSYTIEEKTLICEYITKATVKYRDLLAEVSDLPPMNLFANRELLNGIKDYRGFLCRAGFKFVTIYVNGTVIRCGSPEIYGNILFKNVKLLEMPKVCNTSYCPSFCEKYSLQDKKYAIQPLNIYKKLQGKMTLLYYTLRTDGLEFVINWVSSKLKNKISYHKYS